MVIIVYMVGPWITFHRRPMLEALARQMLGQATMLCINPAISLRQAFSPRGRLYKEGLLSFGGGARRISENLYVGTPVVLFLGDGKGWQENDSIVWKTVSQQIQKAVHEIVPNPGKIISWIYRPEQISCLGLANEDFVVYECYDKYCLSHIDGQEVFGVKELENDLLKKVVLVFTTGLGLYEGLRKKHPRVYYAPNGVKFELFSAAQNRSLSIARELTKIPSPRIGYTGNLSGRVDFELLEKIAKHNSSWSVVIIGPIATEVMDKVNALIRQANVYYLGPRPYELLPNYLKELDVCIIPYKMHEWNDYSNPLKLWEYLAAAKPVVSTRSKELDKFVGVIYMAESDAEFITAIQNALINTDAGRIKAGAKIAEEHSWDKLTLNMFSILKDEAVGVI